MVPVDSVGIPRGPTYSGTLREVMPLSRTGLSPSVVHLSSLVPLTDHFVTPMWKALQPRRGKPPRFGLFPFRSPLLGKSISLSFPADTEMFQFSAFATSAYGFSGLPVRGSRDQRSFDSYPGLFAVFHALQRLLTPRHPPCALRSLATWIQRSRASSHGQHPDRSRGPSNNNALPQITSGPALRPPLQ